MGTIYYGGAATPIHIDDRALAHLKVVIATKLRRNERFTVSWKHAEDQPGGRTTIWLEPSIPLRFVFDDPEPPLLSRAWIEELANSANSSGGIMLNSEHFDTDLVRTLTVSDSVDQARHRESIADAEVTPVQIDAMSAADLPSVIEPTRV